MEDANNNKTTPEADSVQPTTAPAPETPPTITISPLQPLQALDPSQGSKRSHRLFYSVIGALTIMAVVFIAAVIYLWVSPPHLVRTGERKTNTATENSDEASQLISRLDMFVSTVESQIQVFQSSRGPQGLILDFFLAVYNGPLKKGPLPRNAANEFSQKIAPLFEIIDRLNQIKGGLANYNNDGTLPPSGEMENNLLTIEKLNYSLWAWTYQLLTTADQELKSRLPVKKKGGSKARDIHNMLKQVLASGSATNIPSWRDTLDLAALKNTMENFVAYGRELAREEPKSTRRS